MDVLFLVSPTAIGVWIFVCGLMVGSFLNVVIHRLPRGESIVHPRSRCPSCGWSIPSWWNIPIFSWLLLRGRCWSCKSPIAARYPLVELLTGLLWLAAYRRIGLEPFLAVAVAFLSALVVATFVDIDHWEIPDEITIPGTVIAVIARPFVADVPWWDGVVGAALGAFFLGGIRWLYLKLRDVEAMGLGDVKLIAMIGGVLGPMSLLPVILVASTAGSLIGGAVLLFQRSRGGGAETAAPQVDPGQDPAAPVATEPAAPDPNAPPGGDEEDDWEPPPGAIKFGPFLSLGAMAELLLGPLLHLLRP